MASLLYGALASLFAAEQPELIRALAAQCASLLLGRAWSGGTDRRIADLEAHIERLEMELLMLQQEVLEDESGFIAVYRAPPPCGASLGEG